ncbi:hypothetical protein EV378_1468 [Pseudonocardia endophytica]|uniref:N-acetyltransferase domain-containing protein n=1 Tax=Pseudonocardia endophytica TaxID=401976 RepID=A0A4R1HW28_PSEEN|nr:hypothetical protein EV378_1468 [Pseudonocardia endophytica]
MHADVSIPYLDADVRAAVDGLRGCAVSLDDFRGGSWFATASVCGEVVGFARAVRSTATRGFTPALRALGPDRYDEWLACGLELVEVVVGTGSRLLGIGTSLHRAVLTPARGRRAWTQLDGPDPAGTGEWLRHGGWTPVSHDRWTGATVFLDPRHPAVRDGPASSSVVA